MDCDFLYEMGNSMKITIKKPDALDIDNLAILFDKYRMFYGQPSDFDLAFNFIESRIVNEESLILVALQTSGKMLGFIQMYPSFSSVLAEKIWIVNDIYVDQDFRNQGVAIDLLNRAKAHALISGARKLTLNSLKKNVEAQGLYKKIGFDIDADHEIYSLYLKEYNQHAISKSATNKIKI